MRPMERSSREPREDTALEADRLVSTDPPRLPRSDWIAAGKAPIRTPLAEPESEAEAYLPVPEALRQGIGLCLSGGGFRAALFHLGALRRLHELGVLAKLWTISSVSGGSIVAAHLATRFSWPNPGQTNWEGAVAAPLRAFTRRNARTPALANRLLPWNWFRTSAAVEALARRLETRLTPLALADLPALPAFVLCATDMAFGDNWVFQKDRMGAYQPGWVTPFPDDWPLARAVAASACFPPTFNPMRLSFSKEQYVDGHAVESPSGDSALEDVRLTDGGNYDNLALEPVWKDHQIVLVSDGGAPLGFGGSRGLFRRIRRYTSIMENQVRALRKRWLIASFKKRVMHGAYWGISGARCRYDSTDPIGYSKDLARSVIASIRTDMDAFSETEAAVLENHGYLLADIAIQKHLPGLVKRPPPLLSAPHPQWMDEDKVRRALAGSGRTRLLGRW